MITINGGALWERKRGEIERKKMIWWFRDKAEPHALMNRANNYSTWSPFPYSVEKTFLKLWLVCQWEKKKQMKMTAENLITELIYKLPVQRLSLFIFTNQQVSLVCFVLFANVLYNFGLGCQPFTCLVFIVQVSFNFSSTKEIFYFSHLDNDYTCN